MVAARLHNLRPMTETYGLDFSGRQAAMRHAGTPATATLRPDRERSQAFDAAQDCLVEGDNLEALKLLGPAYRGRINMIYIDPPYNTGKDFIYRDDYLSRSDSNAATGTLASRRHCAWLAMMYPRLTVARDLLREDGLLFVSIDDNEVHNLRLLLNEIFGEDNFIAQVIVVSNRGGRDYKKVAVTHEYLLVYGAGPQAKVREQPRAFRPGALTDDKGRYELRDLRNRNPRFTPANRPNLFYPVHIDANAADHNGQCPVTLEPLPGEAVTVEPRNSAGRASVWRWSRGKLEKAIVVGDPQASEVVARQKRGGGWNIYEKFRKATTKAKSVWDARELRSECGTRELRSLLGESTFDHPKPVELLKRCLRLGCDRDGVVLDFFAGSGTLAQAVLELNADDGGQRRFVLVELGRVAKVSPTVAPVTSINDIALARIAAVRRRLELSDGGLRVFAVDPPTADGDASALSEGAAWAAAVALGFPLTSRLEAGPVRGGWQVEDPDSGRRCLLCPQSPTLALLKSAGVVQGEVACRADLWSVNLAERLGDRFHVHRW